MKPDFAYYKGKTITMFSFGPPGSSPDVELRILSPYVAAYLHASVNILDVASTVSPIAAQNLPASQPPNGLTIGTLDTGADINNFVTNTPGLIFSLRAVPLLPSFPTAGSIVVTTPASGLTSFKQLVDSKTPIAALALTNSSSSMGERLLYGAFNIPNRFIYGYSSSSSLIGGFIRGDGESTFLSFAAFQPSILAGKAIPVLQFAKPIKGVAGYSVLKSVPTLEQFAASDPPKTKNGKAELSGLENFQTLGTILFTPVGTPAKLLAALSAALEFSLARGGVVNQAIQDGLTPGVRPAKASKEAIIAVIKQQAQLEKWLAATG